MCVARGEVMCIAKLDLMPPSSPTSTLFQKKEVTLTLTHAEVYFTLIESNK